MEYDEDVYKEVYDDERTEMPLLFDDGWIKISGGGRRLMLEHRLVTLLEELIRLLPEVLLEIPAQRELLRSAARALLAIILETLPWVFLVAHMSDRFSRCVQRSIPGQL